MQKNALPPGAKVHLMGIGGFGVSAIARVMHEQGYKVSGCDMVESTLARSLQDLGISVEFDHSPAHLDTYTPDVVVISSAIPEDHPELEAARVRSIPVYKRADILGELMEDKIGVAIAGTHGKTTTSAMLAHVLTRTGLDPTFIVGGVLIDLGINARAGEGDVFLIEADEYDRMFMGLRPRLIALTALEMDHPDMFDSIDDVRALFREFVDLLPDNGLLVAAHDDLNTLRLARRRLVRDKLVLTYGLTGGMWRAVGVRSNNKGGMDFTALHMGFEVAQVSLRLPGKHNVQNALAVLAMATQLGLPTQEVASVLSEFSGVERRFEVKGEARRVTVIDDYAHHPTAIRATLAASHIRYPGRPVWAIWQPHTFSRTKALLGEFAACFEDAGHVIITDIYRSRDRETFGITPGSVLDLMKDHPDARHIGPLDDVVAYLAEHVKAGDVVIVMSAGDATRVGSGLLEALGN